MLKRPSRSGQELWNAFSARSFTFRSRQQTGGWCDRDSATFGCYVERLYRTRPPDTHPGPRDSSAESLLRLNCAQYRSKRNVGGVVCGHRTVVIVRWRVRDKDRQSITGALRFWKGLIGKNHWFSYKNFNLWSFIVFGKIRINNLGIRNLLFRIPWIISW